MAPPPKYATPAAQLRSLALDARHEGLTFDEFWDLAFPPDRGWILTTTPRAKRPARCVVFPSDSPEAQAWREAIFASRDGWRRAYDRMEPTPEERALRILSPLLLGEGQLGAFPGGLRPASSRVAA